MSADLGGRPRKYATPEEFDAAVNAYVAERVADEKPLTWTGLALALGFACRASIDEYEKYDGFSYSVKRAKTLVEASYEERLAMGEGSPAGSIFALKNFGWKDKQGVELTGAEGGPVETINRIELVALGDDSEDSATA